MYIEDLNIFIIKYYVVPTVEKAINIYEQPILIYMTMKISNNKLVNRYIN